MLYENRLLRKLALPVLRMASFDFTIAHHWAAERRVYLNAFQHKGYWYHGKGREQETMEGFARLIGDGVTVIEVGGHIGYITLYFADLVGASGQVIVFEPGPNNRKYLERNIAKASNVTWVESAVSDSIGTASFYCDNLTGQNNSLMRTFSVFDANAERAGLKAERVEVTVETTTLDEYCASAGIAPDFVKIDIEGAELLAVRGMRNVLRTHRPRLMVEVNEDGKSVERELRDAGYRFFSPELRPDPQGMRFGNNFCIHSDDPILASLGR